MKASRLNARAARDAPLAPMDALAAMLSSPPPPSIPSPTAPSPQVAAGEPEYAGAEDTRGVLRAGGNGGVATAAETAASRSGGGGTGDVTADALERERCARRDAEARARRYASVCFHNGTVQRGPLCDVLHHYRLLHAVQVGSRYE